MSGVLLIAIPVALPIGVLLYSLFLPLDVSSESGDVWVHIRQTVLPTYLYNTFALMALVGSVATIIGVSTAWLSANFSFPLSKILTPALVLPLAAPAYVVGYVYADLFEFAGPVQGFLRTAFDLQGGEYYFPSIRSLGGAGFVIALVLYPYIYLLARSSFMQQSVALHETARVLGADSKRVLWRVALPVARPAIAGGIALVLMETVADYGVVEHFGVPTFTSGIFRTWYAMGEHSAALQLAGWLFVIVALLVVAEQFARRGQHFNPVSRSTPTELVPLTGVKAIGATITCTVPVLLGFVLPFAVLLKHALLQGDPMIGKGFSELLFNSVYVAGIAAILCALAALWLNYAQRLRASTGVKLAVRTATLGYAIPGMVLAVGLLVPLTFLDRALSGFLRDNFEIVGGLFITGTVAGLIFVYVARFLTVAYNSSHMGMAALHYNLDAAARSLGATPSRVLSAIHLPLLRPAVLTGLLLVFIDVMKELPATLIMRPFNFETLATRVFRLASDERLAEASTAALSIILLSLIPTVMILFTKSIKNPD
jgi:iron(III) transport system permease protein